MLVVLALLLALALGVTAQAQDSGVSVTVSAGGEIKIGYAGALSGDLASFGEDILRGIELALEERPNVVIDGQEFPVVIDPQDDSCSAEGGQAIASRFVADDQIVGVVGPMCSSACNAAAPIFDEAGYSSISASCTAPGLTTSDYTSFNRTVVADGVQGVVIANFIYSNLGITRIATIHDGSDYGEGLVGVVTETFEALGGEVVNADAVNVGDTDFRSLLEDSVAADPELIYFGGFAPEGSRLVTQLRQDVGSDLPFMGADGIYLGDFAELAGEQAEGVYSSASIPSATNEEALTAFRERYVERYGVEPASAFSTNSYDAANILLDAIEAVGVLADGTLTIDRAALSEYLRSVADYQGLSGVLTCDGTGECSSAEIGVFQYAADGTLAEVATGTIDAGEVVITPTE
jgi:branched-chain amino acid transport system substrate-binding protein